MRKRRSILSRGQTDDVLEYLREMALIINPASEAISARDTSGLEISRQASSILSCRT